ncbi:rhodanese-like domain-containing protein 6 isoform X1 [Cucurbita moschata]|uniref:Rhodanese-like domain-containing protein 6 isoform X1 n=1 Tax=Cucurbita moschata TaxID=3662 RepID=A0A6J1EUT2_CUCMO|nr:rhodanese-like domain-containing protein 6 isoform X1 [Cucurbita moschata]
MANGEDDDHQFGVLLYYKYAQIPDLDDLVSFYKSNCISLGLVGRVRLASQGVNVTVCGKLCSLKSHIAVMNLNSLFDGTDFKLASCHQPMNDVVARECGFTSLSVRVVQELVTLRSNPLLKLPEITEAGTHLSAAEFHSVLERAGLLSDEKKRIHSKDVVLLDARNLYETRVGKFKTPNIETLDPEIRQYSDLSCWIDDNSEKLRGKQILMYCTGGIRCEMASAYIKSKGSEFQNVFQLYGGIQRYLEQFPYGGFFSGKNFVFDHRISVGSSTEDIIGTCLSCGDPFDDYSSRCRCKYCRMLVLVCDNCQKKNTLYVCELCRKNGKDGGPISQFQSTKLEIVSQQSDHEIGSQQLPWSNGKVCRSPRKLRVLCLHGFRQNASSFKGRTASLAKKLKTMVEFVYVDAPHELSFIYHPRDRETCVTSSVQPNCPPPVEHCKKKFAWLIAEDNTGERSETKWEVADALFDPLQYQKQTDGFEESLAYLKTVFSEKGPFDGILGFSQGAAMTAAVCSRKMSVKGAVDVRFAVLCSGFPLQIPELEHGVISCPSLHIFGSDQGNDRQIANKMSRDLASCFDAGCSVIIEHDSGHVIPTRSPYIDEIKVFLQRFL